MSLWNSDSLLGYYVRYKQDVEDDASWQYHHADDSGLIVINLKPGQKYTSNVQAYNYWGGGPWSLGASAYVEAGIQC